MIKKPNFEALFNASPYPYLLMSAPDLIIIGANAAYLRGTGRKLEEILGKYVFDAFPANPQDPDSTNIYEVRTSLERAIATKTPDNTAFVRYAVPVQAPEGTSFKEIYWSTIHTPILDDSGEVAFVAQNAIDVTDLYKFDKTYQQPSLRDKLQSQRSVSDFNQAQMHEAMTRILNDERSHLRALFNQAPGFIAVLKGKNHVFELANEAYYQLVGHRDLIGKPVWKALPEVAGQGFEQLLNNVYESRKPFVGRGLKIDIQKAPGEPLQVSYVDLLYQPIFDSSGAVTGIFAQGHDVTETHRAYEKLAEKIEQLESARMRQAFTLQLTDMLRHLMKSSEIFTETSRLLGEYLKVSRVLFCDYDSQHKMATYHSNYVASEISELNGTYPVAGFGTENFELLESGKTWISANTKEDFRAAGPDTWPAFEALSIYSAVGVPLSRSGLLISCLFINDNKPRDWTDDELELIRDAAERTWNALERTRAEESLREADRRKDQFLAMLGHELRNPLSPISAAAELLQIAASDPARVKSTSKIIARQVAHMTGIVDDLLDVSRVTSGLVVLDINEVDMKTVVADAVEQIRPFIDSRGHRFQLEIPQDAAYIAGDQKRLVQVLANLINNAAKYTPEGGNLTLHMGVTEKEVVIRVSDDGIGIEPKLLPFIFDLFSQGERSADRSQGGLGLGLALVRTLVELHGGSVKASSKGLGKGSDFTVRFAHLPSHARKPSTDNKKNATLPLIDSQSLRIMIVDDNQDAANMLALFLDTAGHQITVEYDPSDALERAFSQPYDVFLLDIGLPNMDGTELARRLRALPTGKRAMMVAITGYGLQFDRKNALKAGFDHYFVKPAEPNKLLTLLNDFKKR